jgi:hypothetical protein
MMMSKPAPEKSVEEDTLPAFATLPETKKKTPQSAVEDLERRLELLGGGSGASAPPDVVATDDEEEHKSPAVAAAAAAPEHATAVPLKGGKNALLVSLDDS